jgi:hypothetical protein
LRISITLYLTLLGAIWPQIPGTKPSEQNLLVQVRSQGLQNKTCWCKSVYEIESSYYTQLVSVAAPVPAAHGSVFNIYIL